MKKVIKTLLTILLVLFLGFVTIVGYFFYQMTGPQYFQKNNFNTAEWKQNLEKFNDIKLFMVDDLLKNHQLIGKTRDEVKSILGVPPPTDYFQDYDYVYRLGREGGLGVDSKWLGLKFENDLVISADILRD